MKVNQPINYHILHREDTTPRLDVGILASAINAHWESIVKHVGSVMVSAKDVLCAIQLLDINFSLVSGASTSAKAIESALGSSMLCVPAYTIQGKRYYFLASLSLSNAALDEFTELEVNEQALTIWQANWMFFSGQEGRGTDSQIA